MRIIRTTFILAVLTLFLMMVGAYLGGRNGMTIGLGFAICTNAFAYFFSDKIALKSSGAQPVTREQLPRLYAVMERLAAKSNIPVPKLYVVPEQAPNAFATGRNPRHASVAVTEGLLQLMNDDELEGVIAHELSHVRNYDILTSSVAATLAGAITWIAHWGPWLGGGDEDDRDRGGGRARHTSFFPRSAWSGATAIGALAAARVLRRRNRRTHGWQSVRVNERLAKVGRLQQSHSDNVDHTEYLCALHC